MVYLHTGPMGVHRACFFTTTKNAAKTPQINKRNRLPLSALRCHRDRLSTTILAPFLAVAFLSLGQGEPLPRSGIAREINLLSCASCLSSRTNSRALGRI